MSEFGQGFVTVTQLVKVGEESLLALHTNILPCSTSSMGESSSVEQAEIKPRSSYAWFNDMLNQRLLVFSHDIIHAKATETIRAEFEGGAGCSTLPTSTTHCNEYYHFRSSGGLRGLFMFKPSKFRHNILVSNHTSVPSTPCVAFVTDYGRQVLPFLSTASTGSGYSSYRILPESLHAFVDNHEVTSAQGIFKILASLDPNHQLSSNVSSYFNNTNPVVSKQTDGRSEDFPEVPIAGLRYRPSKRKAKSSNHVAKRARIDKNVAKLSNQPIISDILVKKSEEESSGPTILLNETKLPPIVINELSDFVSELESCASNVTIFGDNDPCIGVHDDLDKGETSPNPEFPNPRSTLCTTVNSAQSNTSANKGTDDFAPPVRVTGLESKCLELKGNDRKAPVSHDDDNRTSSCKMDDVTINRSAKSQWKFLETLSDEDYGLIDTPTSSDVEHTDKLPPISSLSPLQLFNDTVNKTPSVTPKYNRSIGHCLNSEPTDEIILDDVTNLFCESPTIVLSGSSDSSVTSTTTTLCSQASDFILVTSDDEPDVVCTGIQEGIKCTKILTLEEIIGSTKNVSDLSKKQLIQWMKLHKPNIVNIFKGRVSSSRHTQYNTDIRKRAALVHCVDTSMFQESEIKTMIDCLVRMFCAKSMKFFDYVMLVLLPECVIQLIADVHKVPFDEAEHMMYNYESIDRTQSDQP